MQGTSVKIPYSDLIGNMEIKKNTYILQMRVKINTMKQMVAISTMRNHSVEGF